MYAVRLWSVRNARQLEWLYDGLESALSRLHPLLRRIGYGRLELLCANAAPTNVSEVSS